MCPMCMAGAAVIVAGGASGAGVIGLIVLKVRAMRRRTTRV